ncbi:DUF1688-domain-containing protein [Fistulina hepatica ATCC 64428]|uniref:DUF1688-domain-containing protein n=1 Tax=Fistulina hepatica ATCC 64428 TaxID=1128425 RepID=A0A0D7AEB8_9AGAR|nr:DUF1688-domain-containing protein [Fistulina hepatica ATCC 64428]
MNLTAEIPLASKAAYLRTLSSIRDRCGQVFELAKAGKLDYFDYHPEREEDVIVFCANIVQRDFGTDYASIPPHGRWRHLDAGHARVEPMMAKWDVDVKEKTRRIIDIFVVSVLLDAGAGNAWKYHEESSDKTFARSEGLGVASIHMFKQGFFSSDPSQPYQVDAAGLAKVTAENTAKAMQVSEANPMVGLEGRASLLSRLSIALKENPQFFGADGRPGNVIDFLENESIQQNDTRVVPIAALWHALLDGFNAIWPPSRTKLAGLSLGDVWPCSSLKTAFPAEGDDLVPFHKLTGWMTYSLIEPIQKILGWQFEGIEDMTGLPEYRNGGLLVDLGILTLKPNALPLNANGLPHAEPSHPAIVEWRAVTVIELDRIAAGLRKKLGADLSLAQVLESATWKGGREIAKQKRSATGGPPIEIDSDGTVF